MQGQRFFLKQVSEDEFGMVASNLCVYSEADAKMDVHRQV